MSHNIKQQVKSNYGAVAQSGLSSEHSGVKSVAEAFGYSPEELASIPAEANLGLSCGNPTATANLKPGEVVVDLGCGGGLDVLLAATKVGATGKAIGIDMTEEMIALAQRNAAKHLGGQSGRNVEFHLASIDNIPLADNTADCVISNCVINLAPDKQAVFREIARILKPGGRLAVSDIALKKPLPDELGQDIMAYVGCIAGAIPIEDYRRGLIAAGFSQVEVLDTGADLNAYAKVENQAACCSPPAALSQNLPVIQTATGCCSAPVEEAATGCCSAPVETATGCCSAPVEEAATSDLHKRLLDLLQRYNVNDYAASVRVFAVKP